MNARESPNKKPTLEQSFIGGKRDVFIVAPNHLIFVMSTNVRGLH